MTWKQGRLLGGGGDGRTEKQDEEGGEEGKSSGLPNGGGEWNRNSRRKMEQIPSPLSSNSVKDMRVNNNLTLSTQFI